MVLHKFEPVSFIKDSERHPQMRLGPFTVVSCTRYEQFTVLRVVPLARHDDRFTSLSSTLQAAFLLILCTVHNEQSADNRLTDGPHALGHLHGCPGHDRHHVHIREHRQSIRTTPEHKLDRHRIHAVSDELPVKFYNLTHAVTMSDSALQTAIWQGMPPHPRAWMIGY